MLQAAAAVAAQGVFTPGPLLPFSPSVGLLSSSFSTPKHRPSLHFVPARYSPDPQQPFILAQLPEDDEDGGDEEGEGPLQLPSSISSIFSTTDDPTPLQTATSLLLTASISVFLFRSLRRRARRSKELKFRSSGAQKSLKEQALESLKTMTPTLDGAKSSPSPVQAFIGGLTAGAIALLLYKFTTTIEASLNRQALSDNFSVRQITITIRTIINGICYLATFVFGINSLGLFLYSGQLAMNSFMGFSASGETSSGKQAKSTSSGASKGMAESSDMEIADDNQRSDDTQQK